MENDRNFGIIWKALFIVGSIGAAVFAVDGRYVTNTVFTEYKDGTISGIIARLDRIESKLDAVISADNRK